eukprot:CAMPEP_0194347706 /NCGR_PEP_ID=MMETSP0171-20130528/106138_1 /TAXON_ID=218684 /ORGANISM="Corethron pennatum, Strain L29A3" /LENGTH=912 /DNA_ID=CAMNT_0039114989 /DNA_START=165 /DNA_END=2904 /DNA_ORIENTATION=+
MEGGQVASYVFAMDPDTANVNDISGKEEEEQESSRAVEIVPAQSAPPSLQLNSMNDTAIECSIDDEERIRNDQWVDAKSHTCQGNHIVCEEQSGSLQTIVVTPASLQSDDIDNSVIDHALSKLKLFGKHSAWIKQFIRLRKYVEANGNTRVPYIYRPIYRNDRSLGRWVHDQRRYMRRLLKGKKDAYITIERIAVLQTVNFFWGSYAEGIQVRDYLSSNKVRDYLDSKVGSFVHNKRKREQEEVPAHVNFKTDTIDLEMAQLAQRPPTHHCVDDKSIDRILGEARLEVAHGPYSSKLLLFHELWEEQFGHLREFVATHNNARVSITRPSEEGRQGPRCDAGHGQRHLTLHSWASRQRSEMIKILKGRDGRLSIKRIEALEAVGFWWGPKVKHEQVTSYLAYNKRKREQEEVPEHVNVKTDTIDLEMAQLAQRPPTHHCVDDKSIDRILGEARLEVTYGPYSSSRLLFHEAWEKQFGHLRKFVAIHNNTRVSARYGDLTLSRWASKQRSEMVKILKGRVGKLGIKRIEALEALGFWWGPKENMSKYLATFLLWTFLLWTFLGFWWGPKVKHEQVTSYLSSMDLSPIDLSPVDDGSINSISVESKEEQDNIIDCAMDLSPMDDGSINSVSVERKEEQDNIINRALSKLRLSGNHMEWEKHFDCLRKYVEAHGHAKVPSNYEANLYLGTWVAYQQKYMCWNLMGKKCYLSIEKIAVLQAVGFFWGSWVRESQVRDYVLLKPNVISFDKTEAIETKSQQSSTLEVSESSWIHLDPKELKETTKDISKPMSTRQNSHLSGRRVSPLVDCDEKSDANALEFDCKTDCVTHNKKKRKREEVQAHPNLKVDSADLPAATKMKHLAPAATKMKHLAFRLLEPFISAYQNYFLVDKSVSPLIGSKKQSDAKASENFISKSIS